LKVDPDNRDIRVALGLLYYDMNKFDSAIAEFSAILQKNITDDKVRYLLATTYEEKGENKLAFKEYRDISIASELYVNSQIRAGIILKKEGKVTESIALIKEAIKKKNDPTTLYLFLSSLYEEAKDIVAAENILVEGIKIAPLDIELHYALAIIYEKTNRLSESINEMEKVLKIDPNNAEALNFIGYSYADRGINLDEAEKMIVRALEIKPDNGYMMDSLGWVYFKQNKLSNAEKYLKQAMELLPDEAEIIEHMGDIYVKLNKTKEAREMYERVLKIDSKNSSVQKKIEDMTKYKQ
jgi:tetratricopeptide (TPR) repeat protein